LLSNNSNQQQKNHPDGAALAYQLRKVIHSHFPGLMKLLAAVPDHRKRRVYTPQEIISAAIALFSFKEQSRNAINNDRQYSREFCSNFEKLFHCKLPHQDTVQLFFKQLPPEKLSSVQTALVSYLIEKRVLERYRVQGCYTIAFDGSGVISGSADRYGCGLKRESKAGVSFQYHVLEARLVTDSGLCLPIASEWITNEQQAEYDKQDCENKAFKRLAVKIKKAFPRLPVCVLADALYANNPIISICEQYGWKYIITLKDGSLPGVQRCLADDPPTTRNSFIHTPKCDNKYQSITQQYYWVNDLTHEKHWFHYISCKETVCNTHTQKATTTHFARITNMEVNADTVIRLSKAGRLRWKIENEGFNTLKNDGYEMQHLFSRKCFNAQKNYYQCLLIAHMINQFVEQSLMVQDLLAENKKLTIKYLWQQLMEAIRGQCLCTETIQRIENTKHQIRLRSG